MTFSFPSNPNNTQNVLEAKVLDSKIFLLFPFLEQFCVPDSSLKKKGGGGGRGSASNVRGMLRVPGEKKQFS